MGIEVFYIFKQKSFRTFVFQYSKYLKKEISPPLVIETLSVSCDGKRLTGKSSQKEIEVGNLG